VRTGGLVPAVGEPPPSLEKRGGPEKAIPVPPMAGTAGRTAETQNAFIVAVEPPALVNGYASRLRLRLDHAIAKHADALDLQLDNVARLDEAQVLEPTAVADGA
jgi:hypothetical protein